MLCLRVKFTVTAQLFEPEGDDSCGNDEADSFYQYDMHGDMAEITNATFKHFVGQHDVVLLLFFEHGCQPCQDSADKFDELATSLKSGNPAVRMGRVDGELSVNQKLLDSLQVESFPMLIWFWRGRPYPYDGGFEMPLMGQHFHARAKECRHKGPPPVTRIGDISFNATSYASPLMLVEFFAPWCGHCKAFRPVFEEACEELREEKRRVMCAEVDATRSIALSERFQVKSYPTLKMFRHGVPYETPALKSADAVVKFISEQSLPGFTTVENVEDLQAIFNTNQRKEISDRFVLFCLEKASLKDPGIMNLFSHVVNVLRGRISFALSTEKSLCSAIGPHESISVVLDQRFASAYEQAVQSADIGAFNETDPDLRFANGNKVGKALEVLEWVRGRLKPLVGFLTSQNYEAVWRQKRPLLVAFAEGNYSTDFSIADSMLRNYRDNILPVAEKFSKYMYFAMAEPDDTDGLLDQFGMVDMQGIAIGVYGKDGSKHKMKRNGDAFDALSLDSFVTEFFNGKTIPFMKSAPLPSAAALEQSDSMIVVGDSFEDIVLDETADVLIMMYSPTCPHCKQLLPHYEQLAAKFSQLGADSVIIAKMDATVNDPMPGYPVLAYPTIYIAPRGNKKAPVMYSQMARSPEDFVKFIASHAVGALPPELLMLTNADFTFQEADV
eukprot:SAG11_NODE_365_length_10153_cov_3.204695_7_plen_669_part_00